MASSDYITEGEALAKQEKYTSKETWVNHKHATGMR